MVQVKDSKEVAVADAAGGGGGGGVSLGKGAWDCDRNTEIPPEAEVNPALTARCTTPHRRSKSLRCWPQSSVRVTPAYV